MIRFALRNLVRRPLRTLLTMGGLAVSVATLACLSAFGSGYQNALHSELDGMGVQMMLVPLGCPYDAAARVLKGGALDTSLPQSALKQARLDGAVSVAAPMLMVAVPRPDQGRTDMWAGIDRTGVQLKPWWKVQAGSDWFTHSNSVLLGAEAAATEARAPGDKFFSPETNRTFVVAGVLQRSGTADDSLFFVSLATAQKMFGQPKRLTAIAIRLRDPSLLGEASKRLQNIGGAQIVTLTEMMGTFLNLVGTVRILLFSIAIIALVVSGLGAFNTALSAVVERTSELAMLRAMGASRLQVFSLIALESLLLALAGSFLGLLLCALAGRALEMVVRGWVPFAPQQSLLQLSTQVLAGCLMAGLGAGILAGFYPAWRAGRLQPALSSKVDM